MIRRLPFTLVLSCFFFVGFARAADAAYAVKMESVPADAVLSLAEASSSSDVAVVTAPAVEASTALEEGATDALTRVFGSASYASAATQGDLSPRMDELFLSSLLELAAPQLQRGRACGSC